MSDTKRLENRNAEIAAMLSDGNRIRNFYRFVAQNPHITLHDACQIIIERPNASVCFSFEEWNAMDRRVTRGRKGIPYYDADGNKCFVFDANDTHGNTRYKRLIYPMKRLLAGLDELNGTSLADDERSDYRKIHNGVATYLQDNNRLTGDETYNGLLIEGVTYSLYSKTGFPKDNGISLHGLPYDLKENSELFKEIYIATALLQEEAEEAFIRKQEEVKIIDDTDEETVSDEPTIGVQPKKTVEIHSAVKSNYKGMVALVRYTDTSKPHSPEEIYLGKSENYTPGVYDNSDDSLILLSNNPKMYGFLYGNGWVLSQQRMVEEGHFTAQDYKEFNDLSNGILSQFERTGEIKFGIDLEVRGSGTPFKYPDWQDEKSTAVQVEETKKRPTVTPLYERYLRGQAIDEKAIVVMRLGDFYEVMGENAKTVAEELNLTLTGRNVGFPERIPMCGFPYHVADNYIDKILKNHSVIVLENDKEPIRILSYAEALEQVSEAEEQPEAEDTTPSDSLIDITDDEGADVFAEEDFDDDIFAAFENGDFDSSDETAEQEEIVDDEEAEEIITAPKPKEKVVKQPREKKEEKRIKDRKRKGKAQASIFDLIESDNQSDEERLIEYGLLRESNRKYRIVAKYAENPTVGAFTQFIKSVYGVGGCLITGYADSYDSKGLTLERRDKEHPENNISVSLKWSDVAVRIADLIDDDKYLTEEEKQGYVRYELEQNKIREQREEEKRRRDSFIEKVILATPLDRKERFIKAYREKEQGEFINTVRADYGDRTVEMQDDYRVMFNPVGVWMTKYDKDGNTENQFGVSWEEYAGKVAALIQNDTFLSLDEEEDADWDYLIDNGIMKPYVPEVPTQDTTTQDNTDLNEVLDQSELGGAKARFKGNIEAIKLVQRLERMDRPPTQEEKKVLARYVGWGGLAQAFDERNEQWRKEYEELKATLSVEDYERAKGSVLNAHYTSKDVIDGIYAALSRFGVKGNNRILEPAMGTGNFFGYMPQEVADGARLYGVELDNLTGRIAKKLYPQANVQIKGFEETMFSNNSFDIVVGNVPFGAYSVYDSEYAKQNFHIHDYFLAKSIDKLKPNGLMAVITSSGTMDKLNPTVRKYLAERAELIGAIRLPNDAFKQTANTEVVADILFFRKREEKFYADTDNTEWLSTSETEQGYTINNYFVKHPEMVLGTLAKEIGMYGAMDVTVKSDGRNLTEAISEAVKNLPENFYVNPEVSAADDEREAEVDYDVKPLCYKAENGKLYMRVGDKMVEQTVPKSPKDAYERITAMIALRNELHHILDLQIEGCSDDALKMAQRELNNRYDRFISKYGYLNNQTNSKLFKDDGDSALLFACENLSEDKKTATKADIFTKRTIRPYVSVTSTDDCYEALQISKNERGKVDIEYIEELTKKDYDTVLTELGTAIFRNPSKVDSADKYSGFETAEEYLSGNVAKKLHTAKLFAAEFPERGYDVNVTALEQVQPAPLTASEISVRLGASWVNKQYYKEFICHILNVPWYYAEGLELYYNPHDSSWRVDKTQMIRNYTSMRSKEVYGTERANAFRLFEDCLNLRATTIYDTIQTSDGEKRVLNQAETIAAREKQNKIKEEFKNWIFEQPERREDLERTYNALFNQIRLPTYDGSYLKFPEMNPAIELKPHQKNAVHRILTDGNALLHHVVGSGKTFTICASIMKLRQYGLAKKPMVAVPNHLVQQWASEFRKLYPKANILVANKEDLEKDNRQKFVSKVAMGDWDAVIIAQSSFAKINISPERQIQKINEEIASIEACIQQQWEESGMPRGAVKNLERIKKTREAQLKKLTDDSKKDNVLIFEKLGVDYLFIDEAHYYKNLFLFTKMNNVAGISNAASQRASDLQLKCEYINELHGGDKGVVFATGTPISNSMTEMYTMQKYLQPSVLKELGLEYFDGWAADFGETVTSLEMTPSGQGYKPRTRFSKFTNLPELLTLYRSFADVQTSDMVKLDVPEAERTVVTLKPSDTVIDLAEQIAERAEKINDGGVDPHIDNMLKVTSDGKKLALDPRCFDRLSADESGSKLNECAQRVFEIWEETTESKGTQIVFCDLSTPKTAFENYDYGADFDVYNDLKYKLVEMGIPQDEIAFIHDANSDLQKQALFDKVNSGAVRVLIGSTEKCGAGTNVQERLIALHHLDTPYRPSDLQQREGRIIRQGNTNDKVRIFTYVTERTFDSYSYQILENKQRFISQIDRGDLTVREAEDIDETTLSYAEIKAITAANPRIKRKMEIDTEVSRLRTLEGQYKKNLYSLQDKIRKTLPEQIHRQELLVANAEADSARIKEQYNPEVFSISVNDTVYTDKKEGGRAFTDALYASRPQTVVAEYCGMKISIDPIQTLTSERTITLAGAGQYTSGIGQSASGNLTRLDNFMEDFPNRLDRLKRKLEQLQEDLKTAQEQVKVPFEHQEKLADLLKEQAEINAELDLGKREEVIIDETAEAEETKVTTEDEQFMELPTQAISKAVPSKLKRRKGLTKSNIATYEQQKKKTPGAYHFIRNGYRYDLVGDEAVQYAKEQGLTLITDNVDGKDIKVVSFELDEIDKHIRALAESGKQVAVIEELNDKQEVDFIDDEDKIAAMETEILPDYTQTQESMHDYGYKWDGMLPIRKRTAAQLKKLGVPIHCLYRNDTDVEADNLDDIYNHDGKFGVEKPDWIAFIETERAREYLSARHEICEAASKGVSKELDYVDERFTIDFIETNFTERTALARYLNIRPTVAIEEMKPYIPELLDEFTNRIGGSYLEYYGWDYGNVTQMLAQYIPNDELKGYTQELIKSPFNIEKELIKILDGMSKEQVDDMNLPPFDDELTVVEKEPPTLLDESSAIKSYKEGVLLLHNDTTGNWFVINDTSARNKYGKPLDKGDETDVMTVLYYNGLYDGNPLREFYSEKEARDYYDDKVRAIRSVTVNKAYPPIYYNHLGEAYSNSELEAYRQSMSLNKACLKSINEAISANYSDNRLAGGFEKAIVDEYGMDRVKFVMATIIREHEWDRRYSRENVEWASTVRIADDENDRRKLFTDTHPVHLNAFADRLRKMEKEMTEHKNQEDIMEQDKYLKVTPRGDEVLSIIQDQDNRNIAVIHRVKMDDYMVAARYDTSDGTWAQGFYDFKDAASAEAFRAEKYGNGEENKRQWLKVKIGSDALIRTYDKHSFMRMPDTVKQFKGYTYNLFNSRMRESTQIVDLQSDTRERCFEVSIAEDETVLLKNRDGDEVELTAREFISYVGSSSSVDYGASRQSDEDKKWVSINLPQEAVRGMYEKSTLIAMPNTSELAGGSFYVPNNFIEEDKRSDGERIVLRLPEDFTLTVKDRKADKETKITAMELNKISDKTEIWDYSRKDSGEAGAPNGEAEENTWQYITVNDKAKIMQYDNTTLLRMPKGKYEAFAYYIPNGLLKHDEEKGTIRVALPEDFEIKLKDNKNSLEVKLTPDEYIAAVKDKTEADYESAYKKPSEEAKKKFMKVEANLRNNVPDEMRLRPNWVAVRTRDNEETGRLEKFLIDCHNGKFARSDDPATWADFETACNYARDNGGVAIAYALDGRDKIACIDLDHCFEENGDMSPLAAEVFRKGKGTYCERSVSGQGLHLFGKTDGMDLRAFSKDGDLEFYQKAHFIAMTGNDYGSSELLSFDTPEMKELLERKCERRSAWKGMGKGIEGLSSLTDRDVVDKACAAKHGDTFKALYNGQDLQNNHSNSDMSLMNRLAYWCNGDKEQMLRIFATSGLFRENKSADYYECTAIKAIKDTTARYQPKAPVNNKPIGNGSGKGGK